MSKYVFKPYDPASSLLFELEKQRLAAFVGNKVKIEHVGSTAVPKLGGKGIIDICIAIKEEQMKKVSEQAQKASYVFKPHASFPDRLFHQIDLPNKEENIQRYHLHIVSKNSQEYFNLIIFRDYLKTHPEAVRRYAYIKKEAAAKACEDKDVYMEIKQPVIEQILKNAILALSKKQRKKLFIELSKYDL